MARFIIGFVLVAILVQCASAQTLHVVGDGMGWSIPTTGGAAAYTSWANGKAFAVGDILLFNFKTNRHDVLQVPKASFDACTDANPIGDIITTGPVNITLDTAGDHYYICTFSQHCQLGQKLAITVSSSSVGTPPGSSPSPPTNITPTTHTTPEAPCPTSDPPTGSRLSPRIIIPYPTAAPGLSSSSSKLLAGVSASVMSVILGLLF